MTSFILNENDVASSLPAGTTLLDFIRYQQQLTGTKIGCREGDCGACTVLIGEIKNDKLVYTSATSCLVAIGNVAQKHVVTIEGINQPGGLNLVQQAFSNEGATQCGFCTPGFIVSLTGHCMSDKQSSYESTIDAVNGNICRCTGYKSIERASVIVNEKLAQKNAGDGLAFAIDNKIIPAYFSTIQNRLLKFNHNAVSKTSGGKLLAGGTDLYVQQQEGMLHEEIDFLWSKPGLRSIVQKDNTCELGAAVTVTDIAESAIFKKHFPALADHIKLVSSTQIRNMATIAGNFINASPIGDLTIFFLALDAQLVLSNGNTTRVLPLRKLYKGYKALDKTPEEWVEKIYFELPAATDHFNFEKVCKRSWLDIASVNTAVFLKMDGSVISAAGISAGGVGPVPAYLQKSSAWLSGKDPATLVLPELLEMIQAEVSPISDVRGTAAYKRLLLSQLVKAHFLILFPQLKNKII